MLIKEVGGNKQLAELLAQTSADGESYNPSVISQLKTGTRNVGPELAERLEKATGKRDGWMDQWLADEGGWDGPVRNADWHLVQQLQDLPDGLKTAIRNQINEYTKLARQNRPRRQKKKTA